MIYECPYCDEWYAKEQALKCHVTKVHKKIENGKIVIDMETVRSG